MKIILKNSICDFRKFLKFYIFETWRGQKKLKGGQTWTNDGQTIPVYKYQKFHFTEPSFIKL